MEVKRAVIGDHWVIEGANLDYLLEEDPSRSLLILDDLYSDLYSDYIFLGYEVYPMPLKSCETGVANLHEALSILMHHKTITICGDDPRPCVALFSLLKVSEGKGELEEVAKSTALELSEIYANSSNIDFKEPIFMGAKALGLLLREMGSSNLGLLMSIARNYDFGKGEKRFNDRISWTVSLDLPLEVVYAQLARFLIEGHGSPKELLELRLDALGGREEVKSVIGERALEILEKFAEGVEDDDYKVLKLIDSLNPGSSNVRYVWRDGNRAFVECKGKCNVNVEEASKLLPIEKYGIEIVEFVTS